MKFTPSPTKIVRFVDKEGNVTKQIPMNRRQRRKLGIGNRGLFLKK